MRWSWVALSVVWIATACARTDDDNRRACEQLRDHMVDLRVANERSDEPIAEPPAPTNPLPTMPAPPPAAVATRPLSERELAAHRQALRQALSDGFLASCERLTPAQRKCALAASDPAALAACSN